MKVLSLSIFFALLLSFISSCANSQDKSSEITVLNQELLGRSEDHLVLKSVEAKKNEYLLSFEAYNTESIKNFSLNAVNSDDHSVPRIKNTKLLQQHQLQPWEKHAFQIQVNNQATYLEIQNCTFQEIDSPMPAPEEYSSLMLALTPRGSEHFSTNILDRKKIFYPLESNGHVAIVDVESSSPKIKMPVNRENRNRYALVVYNSYKNLLPINPAPWYIKNDAQLMKEFFHKVMGVPEENIEFAELTSWLELNNYFGSLCGRAELISGRNAEVYLYFTGLNLNIESNTFDISTIANKINTSKVKQSVLIFDTYNFNLVYNNKPIDPGRPMSDNIDAPFLLISSRLNTDYNSFPNKSKTNSIFVEKFIETASKKGGFVRYQELNHILEKVVPAEGFNLYPGTFRKIEPLFYYNDPKLKQKIIGNI